MSRFLGPIHYLLFGRIETLNSLSEFLINKGKEKDKNFLKEVIIDTIPNKPLDKLLDLMNIHSSLSGWIDLVESKYAMVVKALVSVFNLDEIKAFIFDFGKTIAYEGEINIEEIHKKIDETFLDGMPCDRATEIVLSDEKTIIWRYIRNAHDEYFLKEELPRELFFELRFHLLKGIFSKENISVEYMGNRTYEVRI